MIDRILKSTFLKFTSIVFVGNLLSQLLISISWIVFAWYFEKFDIGVYTVFISLCVLFSVAATARYESALMLPADKKDSSSLLIVSIVLAGIFSLVTYLIFDLIPFQDYFVRFERIEYLISLLPLGIFLLAAFQSFIAFNNKLSNFKINALAKFIQASLMLFTSIWFAQRLGFNATSLTYGWLFSQGSVFLFFLVLFFFQSEKNTLHGMLDLMKEYKRYPLVALPSNVLNVFSIQLPNYLIPMFWSAEIQAISAYGFKVAGMPRNFIGSAVGDVFFTTSSKLAAEYPHDLLSHLRKVTKFLFAFSTVIYAIGILSAWYLFPVVYGPDYAAAVPYFNWMAFASIFMFVQSPISVISDVVNRLKPPLIYNLFSILVKLAVFALAGYILRDPLQMIMLYAISSAALSMFWINYLFKMTKDFTKENSSTES